MDMRDKLELVEDAVYLELRYVDASDAYEKGYVRWSDLEKYSGPGLVPFVEVTGASNGLGGYDASTVDRSNFRALQRDYPNVFLPVSYSNLDTLGFFVHSVDESVIHLATNLGEQYPVYDDSDLSALEDEEITESFEQYLWWDLRDRLTDAENDFVSEMGDRSRLRDAFFSATHEGDYYPEHDGMEVRWDMDRAAEFLRQAIRSLSE